MHAGESEHPSASPCLSVAPAGAPVADGGTRVAWLAAETLHLVVFPAPPLATPPPLSLAGIASETSVPPTPTAGTPAAALAAPVDPVRRRVDTGAILAAVKAAAEGDLPLGGGYARPPGEEAAEPLRCMSAVMGRWHVAVLTAGLDDGERWIACIALVSHVSGEVVRASLLIYVQVLPSDG